MTRAVTTASLSASCSGLYSPLAVEPARSQLLGAASAVARVLASLGNGFADLAEWVAPWLRAEPGNDRN